jgi:hypothetical protein
MGSAKILNLLDRTATDSGDGIGSPKNSAKIALYSFFDVWHYEDNRRSYEVELRRWINFCRSNLPER